MRTLCWLKHVNQLRILKTFTPNISKSILMSLSLYWRRSIRNSLQAKWTKNCSQRHNIHTKSCLNWSSIRRLLAFSWELNNRQKMKELEKAPTSPRRCMSFSRTLNSQMSKIDAIGLHQINHSLFKAKSTIWNSYVYIQVLMVEELSKGLWIPMRSHSPHSVSNMARTSSWGTILSFVITRWRSCVSYISKRWAFSSKKAPPLNPRPLSAARAWATVISVPVQWAKQAQSRARRK